MLSDEACIIVTVGRSNKINLFQPYLHSGISIAVPLIAPLARTGRWGTKPKTP